jgi:5-methylcytosine-specific restriction endonuclease McrA
MPLLKVCCYPGCGRVCATPGANRCPLHPKPPKRTGTYTRNAAKVRAAAVTCYLCGLPFTPDDPAVADHVEPRAYGGSDNIINLRAAHRSCNGRKGAHLPSWTKR